MIRNLVLGSVALGCMAIFYSTTLQHGAKSQFPGGNAVHRPGNWATYNFQTVSNVPGEDYDFAFKLKGGLNGDRAHLRVAFDRRDEQNYSFAELTRESVCIGRVEEDFETILDESEKVLVPNGEVVDCLLKRRKGSVRFVLNGKTVARARGVTSHEGAIFAGTPDQSVDIPAARLQPVGETYFTDDFMRPSGELGEWEILMGDWDVKSLDNPSLSANAFTFQGHSTGMPAIALAGYRFWDSYTFQAAVSGPGCGDIGLVFYAGSVTAKRYLKDYYVFRWAPRRKRGSQADHLWESGHGLGLPGSSTASDQGAGGSRRKARQLVHVVDNRDILLAEAPGGYRSGQWYTMEVRIHGPRIRAFIDGELIFDVSDPQAVGGRFGLYSRCSRNGCALAARFDDVRVAENRDVAADFADGVATDWHPYGGTWRMANGMYEVQAEGAARSVIGDREWKNYRVAAEVSAGSAEWAGLTAAYLDEGTHLCYRVSPEGAQELVRRKDGELQVLKRVERLPAEWNSGVNLLQLVLDSGAVAAEVNGRRELESWVGPGLRGRAGLYAEHANGTAFDNVEVHFLGDAQPVLAVNPVFAHEKSMANWAAADSDWVLAKTILLGGRYLEARVHRMEFHSDVELAVTVERSDRLNSARMSIGTDEAARKGYHFVLDQTSTASGGAPAVRPDWALQPSTSGVMARRGAWMARMVRGETELAARRLPEGLTPTDLRFRRAGALLIGTVNGETVIDFEAREGATGKRIAFAHSGGKVEPKRARVFSSKARCYSFRTAITDWRVGSGTWQMTNRWQCDPRWTFFSGFGPRLACAWNKRKFPGDVCVDLAAGIKMDRNRGGRYEYASDINVTIGGDGSDLTSGYSFMFGGYNNSRTALFRQGTEVATSHMRIPVHTNIHRRWFHIKIARRGSRLGYWIDDKLILEYTDPDPLPGDQMALWTWNNGIMVAQVRISSPDGDELESPGRRTRPVPLCVYD